MKTYLQGLRFPPYICPCHDENTQSTTGGPQQVVPSSPFSLLASNRRCQTEVMPILELKKYMIIEMVHIYKDISFLLSTTYCLLTQLAVIT